MNKAMDQHILYCKMMGSAGKSWVLCEGPHCNGELWWSRGFTNLEFPDRMRTFMGDGSWGQKKHIF